MLATIGAVLNEPSARIQPAALSACDRSAIPLSIENRTALFQGRDVRDNWILSIFIS